MRHNKIFRIKNAQGLARFIASSKAPCTCFYLLPSIENFVHENCTLFPSKLFSSLSVLMSVCLHPFLPSFLFKETQPKISPCLVSIH